MAGRTAIGLDIGTSVVRAAELSFGRAGVSLEKFGQLVLPEGAVRDGEIVEDQVAAVSQAIRELWTAVGFSHKRVVMGVANQRVVVRQLDLPWMPQAELKASLPFQVGDHVPIAVEDSVLDFFPLEEFTESEGEKAGARMLRGLLVAAPHETVLSAVRCAEAAGLTPTAVDLTSFAVLRSMGRQSGLDVETEALIDIGARVTNVIVHSAGVPRFVRILLTGGQDVTDAVAEKLGVPLDQAEGMKQQFGESGTGKELAKVSQAVATTAQDFVDDIRTSLDYYASSSPGAPVERLVISGGGSRLVGLGERLSAAVRVPVLQGDPLSSLRLGNTMLDEDQLRFIKPLAVVPIGLALGAI